MFSSLPRPFHFLAAASFLAANVYAQQPELRQPLITRAVDERELVRLKGNTHPLAKPQFDMGAAPADLPLKRMLLVLKRSPEQDFTLHKLLDDQQDKASPNYHKWLAPEEFGKQFGPADQDIQQITGWLQTRGFEVNRVSKGRSVIEFSGVESQVEDAFHTPIHKYLVNNEEHWANTSDPQIPAAFAPAVEGVWSLHDFRKKPKIVFTGERYVPGATRPAPQITSPTGRHALMPADFATIYNLNPLYAAGVNGQGATIAVVARSAINLADIINFRSSAGLPFAAFKVTDDGPDPGFFDQGEEFEAVLDATWSGAVAPAATVNFVTSASTNTTDGVDLSELYIIDNNAGDVMTESFGSCEGFASSGEAQGLSTLAEQAAAEGITYMVSSGDSGAEGCVAPDNSSANGSQPSVNVLAAPPFTVAVGGTMFNENGNDSAYWNTSNDTANLSSAKSYIPEDVWNESCPTCGLWAGGGGSSTFFSKPNWQFAVPGIPSDGARDLPDVSLTAAAHDPYVVCLGSCFYGVAGTSASAPSFAGIMALVVQQYGRQGQANYVLYRLAAAEKFSQCNGSNTTGSLDPTCIFNDVTQGNNAVPGELNYGTASALHQAGTGYDLATGLGSVNATNLVNKWNSVAFNPTTTTLNLTPLNITHGQAVTASVTVAGSGGITSGSVTLLTSFGQSIGVFNLDSSGSFTGPIHVFPTGYYTVVAKYSGDSKFAPSTSASSPQLGVAEENSVTKVSAFTIDQSGNVVPFSSGPYGSFVYLRGDVTSQSGYGTPSGGSNFFIDNGAILNDGVYRTLNSLGYWTLGYTTFSVGAHAIQAEYEGQGYFPSTSAPINITLVPAATTIAVNQTPQSQGAGFGASISTAGGGSPPTGKVTFIVDNQPVGDSGPLLSIFAAVNSQYGIITPAGATAPSFYASSLAIGTHTVTAKYSGDTNYLSSTSAPLSFSLQPDFSLQVSTNSLVVTAPGGSAAMSVRLDTLDGFSGTVSFSCSGLPAETKCLFNPSTLSASGITALAIETTAPVHHSAAIHHSSRWTWVAAIDTLAIPGLIFLTPWRWRKHRFLAMSLLILFTVACGGGGPSSGSGTNNQTSADPGTPTGTYAVTITASGGSIAHSANVSLVVQ